MSKYKELELLKEQKHTLIQLHMNFSDQLNRLKVEELALTSKLRLQKEREMQAQTGATDETIADEKAIEQETMQVLDLVVNNPASRVIKEDDEEEEEEEDEEDGSNAYNDQLSSYLEQLMHDQKHQQKELHLGMDQEKEEEDDDDDMS